MIYHQDEATGVTVEDRRGASETYVYAHHKDAGCLWRADEADAVLIGLLRWKIAATGADSTALKLVGDLVSEARKR